MDNEQISTDTSGRDDVRELNNSGSRFFQFMAGLLLLILLIGFAPTLYLRGTFEVPKIPLYLHIHGAVITCWFLLFFVQSTLVVKRRTDIHRKLGIAGAALALAVVFAGPMATLNFVGRLREMGIEIEPEIYILSWVVWGNFASILAFAIMVLSGILLRHRKEVHKRLMLLASISIVSPAIGRIGSWSLFDQIGEIPVVIGGSLILLAGVLVHDLVTLRRLPAVTVLAGLCLLVVIVAPPLIASTEFAQAYVRGMG